MRLVSLALKDALARYAKSPPGFASIALQFRGALAPDVLLADVLAAIADRAFVGDDPLPRDEAGFTESVKRARARLPAVADGAFRLLTEIAAEHLALSQQLAGGGATLARLVAELKAQRDALVYPGFFSRTPWAQLKEIPRYLKALARRLAKYPERGARDGQHAARVAELWQRYLERQAADRRAGRHDAEPRGLSVAAGGAPGVAVRPGAEDALPGVVQAPGQGLDGTVAPLTGASCRQGVRARVIWTRNVLKY